MMNVIEMRQKRAALIAQMRAILAKGERENRSNLTADEQREFDRLGVEADGWKARIEAEERVGGEERDLNKSIRGRVGNDGTETADGPEQFGEIRAFRPGERLGESRGRGANDLRLGEYLRGVVTGRWPEETRDYIPMGSTGSGAFLVPLPLSLQLIDMARAQMRVVQAGARTIAMQSATLAMAKVTADPVAAWRNELAPIAKSNPVLTDVTLTARSLAVEATISEEMLADSHLAEDMLLNVLTQAIALEFDRALLFGSGVAPEISGVYTLIGAGGVQEVAAAGADGDTVTQQKFSLAVQAILAANGPSEGLAAIYAPRLAGELDRLLDGNGNPVSARPLASFAALKHLVSGNVPIDQVKGESNDATTAIIGDFSKLIIGIREDVSITAGRGEGDFDNHSVSIKAVMRADMVLTQAAHFACITGLVSPS